MTVTEYEASKQAGKPGSVTFRGQEEEEPGQSSQRGSQGIIRTWSHGRWDRSSRMSGAYTSHFPAGGRGRRQPRHLRLLVQAGVSYLVSSPTLWEEERRKQRRERKPICLSAVGQTPTLRGSPPPPLPCALPAESSREF